MNGSKKNITERIIIFFVLAIILYLALVLSGSIKRESYMENLKKSSDYLFEDGDFHLALKNNNATVIDHYSDAILLTIIYENDSTNPFGSVLLAPYYKDENFGHTNNLQKVIKEDLEPNNQYLRYWHGSLAFIRPLLLVADVQRIYVLNGIILLVLTLSIVGFMAYKKFYGAAAAFLLALIFTYSFIVWECFEYTESYIVMLIAMLVLLHKYNKWQKKSLLTFFMVTGMICNYLDFLTAETITLTMPLVLLIYLDERGGFKRTFKEYGRLSLMWLTGYAGMWVFKWVLAAAVLRINAFEYVVSHIIERAAPYDIQYKGIRAYLFSLINNFKMLFPFSAPDGSVLILIAIALVMSYIWYVFKKAKTAKSNVAYLIPVLIVLLRFLVLSNHSVSHSYHTYRALIGVLFAGFIVWTDSIDIRIKNKRMKGKR